MSARRLPVRPDLDQLRHQAKDLLRAIRRGEPSAVAELQDYHPNAPSPDRAQLADAQLVLARSYQAPSWPRLALACKLIDAIWLDEVDTVKKLVLDHPQLLHEPALIREDSNWGPPLTYAANVGRDRIITLLRGLGADDLIEALGRAVLQGRIDTARLLHGMAGAPRVAADWLEGPAYTLSAAGTAYLFEIGVELERPSGKAWAPVNVVLDSDSRKPKQKHRILELYAQRGFAYPDTPMMALHRGRVDLLERHLRRDPDLLRRTFAYAEIFPPALGCGQPDPETGDERLPRTPVAGSTLLHVAVEFDELDFARWLLEHGMDPNVTAAVDAGGFGGHTALFGAVVSYPHFWMNFSGGWAHSKKPEQADFAELLLDAGANPNPRATLRESSAPGVRVHRDVTPLGWGRAFRDRMVVSEPAMRLLAARGGA